MVPVKGNIPVGTAMVVLSLIVDSRNVETSLTRDNRGEDWRK